LFYDYSGRCAFYGQIENQYAIGLGFSADLS
jgi:hypothetical protein